MQPDNAFLDSDGQLRLGGWGLCITDRDPWGANMQAFRGTVRMTNDMGACTVKLAPTWTSCSRVCRAPAADAIYGT
jgi:hypothetical protein